MYVCVWLASSHCRRTRMLM